ncbi:MAG: hypothetical protein NTV59_07995 [Chloroflexi bacterium]|nr:hypothetical protein [Chloroflexota bacterium]
MTRVLKNRLFIVLLTTVVIVSILAVFWIINRDTTVGPGIAMVEWAEWYDDFEEITATADLVVVGNIDRVVAEMSEGGTPGTEFSFDVDSVLKGEQVTQIVICQLGAAGELEAYDDPLFSSGERYILFLREGEPGKYYVLGGPQGRFMIVGNLVFSMDNVLLDRVYVGALEVNGLPKEAFIDSISEIVAGS